MTTEHKENKSLMIRGDRLLFVFDLMLIMIEGRVETQSFSRKRIEEILDRFITGTEHVGIPIALQEQITDAFDYGGFFAIHALLVTAVHLDSVTFDGNLLFGQAGPFSQTYAVECMDGFRKFVSAIASDELTEADFVEKED